jgi:glycine/D-amino acid oxidase-like deaminating enzyme
VKVVVLGAGIFGVTGASELRRRGHDVTLVDQPGQAPRHSLGAGDSPRSSRLAHPGPLPHPLAASTDISKVVRLEYGGDELYTEMAERSLAGWRQWGPLYHETGVLFLRQSPMAIGTFEDDSFSLLRRRGHAVERLNAAQISARFPAWRGHVDGTFNPEGGFVESGKVVAALLKDLPVVAGSLQSLDEGDGRVRGVVLADGTRLPADVVVAALGSWTPHALPWLASSFRSSGMPVFHLAPPVPSLFTADRFPVFGADISATGWYGFPLHEGVVKLANHGPGRVLHPSSEARVVSDEEIARMRQFVAATFPDLAGAPLAHTRVCVYCDTWDGHFWIAPDPDRAGLVLATGGSGHAFKFAPLLGGLIADAVDGKVHPRFRWRPEARPPKSDEAARHQ